MKLILSVILLATMATAQKPADKSKRPSPPATAQCKFADGNTITVDYSQPSMKGRQIYGGLVPYGQVWRTGANEATTFVTTANLTIFSADTSVGDAHVPKGSYTLYTLPNKDAWKLIISKKTGQWGIPYPGESEDLARTDMKGEKLSSPVEKFTISFNQNGGDACTMRLDWENTRESVEIKEGH